MNTKSSPTTKLSVSATVCAIVFASAALSGCSEEAIQARGFALPPGDASAGEAAFLRLQCHQCHQVAGLELPENTMIDGPVEVALGGPVTVVKSYGDLVTSIINPSHKLKRDPDQQLSADGESFMTVYNDVMTVQELIDIVSFLQTKFELTVPPMRYPIYHYGYAYDKGDEGKDAS